VKTRLLSVLLLLALLGGGAVWFYYYWREHREDSVIRAAAQRYGVEPALVKAVMWRESWFNPRVRGGHGEVGLMQITEIAAGEWADAERVKNFSVEQLVDPATNAFAGTYYLGKLLKRYPRADNPIPFALADYNAGRTHVLRWGKGVAATNSAAFLATMDFPGTKSYIQAIMRRRLHYLPEFVGEPK
jgi:soluble lytic murein transglycosylase